MGIRCFSLIKILTIVAQHGVEGIDFFDDIGFKAKMGLCLCRRKKIKNIDFGVRGSDSIDAPQALHDRRWIPR
jgi:hypothetical protein